MSGLVDSSAVEASANRVQQFLSGDFVFEEQELPVSACLGIAFYPEDGALPQEVVTNAQHAKGQAKLVGLGQIRFYHKDMNANHEHRLNLVRGLRKALANNELKLFYQPKVCPVKCISKSSPRLKSTYQSRQAMQF